MVQNSKRLQPLWNKLTFSRVLLLCIWVTFMLMIFLLYTRNAFKRETLGELTLTVPSETRNLMEYVNIPRDTESVHPRLLETLLQTQQSPLRPENDDLHSSKYVATDIHSEHPSYIELETMKSRVYMANLLRRDDESTYRPLQCDVSKTSPIHIFLCVDRKYKFAFNALFNSIIQNACNVSRLHFHILLDYDTRGAMDRFVQRFERLFVREPVDYTYEFKSPHLEYPQFMESFKYFKRAGFEHRFMKPINFARFYLADIFQNVETGVYLDSDVIVQTDVAHLIDDNDVTMQHPLYAVLEMNPRTLNHERVQLVSNAKKKRRFIQALQPMIAKYNLSEERIRNVLDVNTKTFNNGVMVLNLDYWRTHKLTEQAEFLVKMDKQTGRKFFQIGNQVIYNMLFLMNEGTIGPLNKYWNLWGLARPEWCDDSYVTPEMKGLLDKAYILHYAGNTCKPWQAKAKKLLVAKYYWDYQVYFQ